MEEKQTGITSATALYENADHCIEQRDLLEASVLLQLALKLDEKERPGGQEVIDDLTLLAHVHRELRMFNEAEVFIQRALALAEKQSKGPDMAIFAQLHVLSKITCERGRQWETSPEYRMTACSRAREPHEEDIAAIFAFHKGAFDSVMQGRYEEAASLLRHTLVVHERVLEKTHLHVMLYVNQLAEVYRLQEKFQLAEPLLQRIVTWARGIDSALPVLAVTSLYQLAQCALGQSNITWAGCLAEQAYQEAKKTVGSDHVVAGIALTTKAYVLFFLEWEEEAEEAAEQARELFMEHQTIGSLIQLCAEHDLAHIYYQMGQHEKAVLVLKRVFREGEPRLVANHPLLMFFLHTLAATLAEQKRYNEAGMFYQRALLIAEECLAPEHNFMVQLLEDSIPVYQELKSYEMVEPLYPRLLGIYALRAGESAFYAELLHTHIELLCMKLGKTEKGE